ncbi:MAG: hypothetical protein N2Z22_02535 [Turneriella sp.]|nr:hypothetical protein [Turneriella sp.]
MQKISGRLFVLSAILGFILAACKPADLEFQKMEPRSETALADIFKDTPAIRAAFSTIDPHEFNRRLDRLMQADPVMGVKTMHALGALSKDRPALPQLADSISAVVDRFAQYYQATPERQQEYNTAVDVVNRLLDIDPQAITDGAYLLARIVRYMGESEPLFPISVNHPDVTRVNEYHFPELTTWKVCDDPGSIFLNSRPESDPTDIEGRDMLWGLYDILRTGYCIYANRTGPRVEIVGDGTGAKAEAVVHESVITAIHVTAPGSGYTTATVVIDASPGPGSGATATATISGGQITAITVTSGGSGYVPKADDSPGAFMRNATAVLKNSGDVELRVRNLIYDLTNKLADYTASEKKIADWTVNTSNIVFQSQVAVVDYLIEHAYPITRKDYVFNQGKEILDREAEHLAMLNPDGSTLNKDKYLTEWLLKVLYNDAPKLDDLENFSNVVTTSNLYVFGKDIVENPVYGLNNVTARYPKNLLKGKLLTGSVYTPAGGGSSTHFSGLLANGGPIWKLTQSKSTQSYRNPFRQFMAPRIGSLVTVPLTYNNEYFLEAALKNLYYHILERYYDQTALQWALDAEDAQNSFNDPERNLLGYIAHMQYSLRNMAILDRTGKKPGDAGFSNVPYLTEFLYTIAGANGIVDPVNAPAQLTLQTCLYSMGATDIAPDGIRTINMPWPLPAMDVQVTNQAIAHGIPAASRNDQPFSASLTMFAFELLSPGRFIPRADSELYGADTVNGKFRGRFSPHQGDIESTNLKTSNWMVVEFALSAWEGYGPFSVKGRAPNGSAVKYENDFYTDAFRAKIATGAGAFTTTAFGTNSGDAEWRLDGNGNYHIYEKIYRPRNASDPCWVESQGNTYGYPRYGFIRPQNNTSYWDNSNCASWQKIRIDFDTRDEAIRANIEWVLKDKKYIFVIPMHGYTNMWTLWDNGASFAVFTTIHGNGLWGVTTGKRACSHKTCNGRWNVSAINMGANSDGYVPNSGNGFIAEPAAGAQPGVSVSHTRRLGVQSYTPGDSMVLLDMTFYQWGLTGLFVDVFDQVWNTLGDGPVTPAMIKDNFDSVLTLATALYTSSDILSTGFNGTELTIAKFRRFYDTYFPTDETTCTSGVLTNGANGQPDLYENFLNGCGVTARDLPPVPKLNPDPNNCNEFVQVACVRYPNAYHPTTGAVTSWYAYTGPSDGKLTGMLTPLIVLFGTMHEDGAVIKVTGQATDTLSGVYSAVKYTGALMTGSDSHDNVTIRNFCSNGAPGCPTADLGYRIEIDTLFTALASLNETQKNAGNNLPQYNTGALTNILTESAAGLRNGFLPKLTNNKYANVAYIDPLIRDLEAVISDNVRNAMDNFQLTSGSIQTASGMKNRDRLRYFMTKNVINPEFTVEKFLATSPGIVQKKNHGLEVNDKVYLTTTGSLPSGLTPGNPNTGPFYYVKGPVTADTFRLSSTPGGSAINFGSAGTGTSKVHPVGFRTNRFDQSVNGTPLNGVPINMLKEFVKYLRSLASDAEVVTAIKAAIPVINNYLANVQGSTTQITITDEDIDHMVSFLKDKNSSGDYTIESFLDMVVATKLDDINTLRSFNFEQFKTLGSYQAVLDDMNDKIAKYFEKNIKKDILYSPFMLGEPTCPGGYQNGYYDHNENNRWDPGTFTFISAAYSGASSWTDQANKNGTCTITTPIPNIYDKDYYMFDMGGVARNLQRAVEDITAADVDEVLDWLYGRNLTGANSDVVYGPNPHNGNVVECHIHWTASGGGINFDYEIKALKNFLLCEFYNKKIDEPHYDRNGNNIIEAGEYTDVNNNNQYDNKSSASAINMRQIIHYYLEDVFMPKYLDMTQPDPLSPNKNYLHFAATALKDLFAPTLCDANGLNCGTNINYVTADLLHARQLLYDSTNFTAAELKAVKNVVGNFLYDQDTGTYTQLIARTAPHIVTVLREFQGDYNDMLNMGLEGFKPDGFLTYFSTNLTNKPPYTSLDILREIRILFNSQVMRCYPGITREYFGGPAYCRRYRALDTFWGQFGLLMDQFSTAAFNKYKGRWQSQMAPNFYARLVSIFE